MNVFGHIGLSLAIAYAVERTVRRRPERRIAMPVSGDALSMLDAQSYSGVTTHIGERISLDHRLVVIGSMLPDIIDKPLALLIAPDLVNHSTRNFGHTALFGLLLVVLAFWWLHRTGGFAVLTFGIATAGHLVFDQMWKIHETLLFPFFGTQFEYPVGDVSAWTRSLASQLYTSPPELIGALSLLFLAYRVVRARAVSSFFRTGRIP